MVATVTAFLIVVLAGGDEDVPIATATATPDLPATAAITGALALRSAPAGDTAITGRLDAGTEVRILGRTEDSTWLLVDVPAQAGLSGWLVAVAVTPSPDLATLSVVAPTATATASPTRSAGNVTVTPTALPTFTPDRPDLRIDSIFSRDNRVTVVVSNAGVVDLIAEILISVDGGDPRLADIKPGEPLRPDEQLEIRLDDEYVQRRALIRATVTTSPEVEEDNLDNNSLETVIAPDIPNDLGIASVAFDGPEGALRVILQNNSTIPITGAATITVRERTELRTRLATQQPQFSLEPGATVAVDFPEIVELTIDDIEISLSTDAVNDADPANDLFPQ